MNKLLILSLLSVMAAEVHSRAVIQYDELMEITTSDTGKVSYRVERGYIKIGTEIKKHKNQCVETNAEIIDVNDFQLDFNPDLKIQNVNLKSTSRTVACPKNKV